MAKKYVVRNGVKIPEEKAVEVARLRIKGYSTAWIAEKLGLTEHEVVSILNVNDK